MNDSQKHALLKVAKDTVEAAITRKNLPKVEADDPELAANCGCFVTLKNGEQLRGCLGNFTGDRPLVDMVVEMPVHAV